jgi:hypothetical protein
MCMKSPKMPEMPTPAAPAPPPERPAEELDMEEERNRKRNIAKNGMSRLRISLSD